ncbi:MAG TPA: DUF177 domain-containing protein [Candidatus Saccharimonadales bacterium]|nr:DUF177 domain-containing protein [Candidatus Saccharimonadales bacterium]
MELKLHEIDEGLSRLTLEVRPESVGIDPRDVTLEGPLTIGLTLDRRGDEIWIRGTIHGVALQQCSRCLVDFSQILELEFEVFCAKLPSARTMSPKALDEEDGGVHFHDGHVLSIDSEIREAVLLGLPMRPLCREMCAGLCPRCGEDRNQGACRCVAAAAERRE